MNPGSQTRFSAGQIGLLNDLIIAEHTARPGFPSSVSRFEAEKLIRDILLGQERLDAYVRELQERHVAPDRRLPDANVTDMILDFRFDDLDDSSMARLLLSPGSMNDLFDQLPLRGAQQWQNLLAEKGALQLRTRPAVQDKVLEDLGLAPLRVDDELPENDPRSAWQCDAELVLSSGFGGFRGVGFKSAGAEKPPRFAGAGTWQLLGPGGSSIQLPESLSRRCYGQNSAAVSILIMSSPADNEAGTVILQAGVSPAPTIEGFTLTLRLPGNRDAVMVFGRSTSAQAIRSAKSGPVPIQLLISSPTKLTIKLS